jgi:hypothetical protein
MTDLVFTSSVSPTLSDGDQLVPMVDRTIVVTRQLLKKVLTDSGYPSGEDLAQCKARNVEIIAPWNENSFTAEKRAQAGEDGPIRVFVRKISALCAHLFNELCCSGNGLWYAVIIQLNGRSQQLMAPLADVPAMAARHFRNQSSYV